MATRSSGAAGSRAGLTTGSWNATLSRGWNGTWSRSGSGVTVTNAAGNGALATGASTSAGGDFTYSGANTAPGAFNGVACG